MESETVVSEIVEVTSPSQDIKVRINGFRRLTKPFYNFFLLETSEVITIVENLTSH